MATLGRINLPKTGDMQKDFENYTIELERRLKHYLANIPLSSIMVDPNSGKLVSVSSVGKLESVIDSSEPQFAGISLGDITNGNYSYFTNNGTLVAKGTATTFDDLLGDISRIKVVGVGIVADDTENAIKFQTSANLSDYALANYQIRHKWKCDTSVFPHIHFEQSQNNIPNFLIQARWQRNLATKTTAWTYYKCNTLATTYTSGTINNIASTGAVIPPSGCSISDIIQLRIYRDNSNASGLFTGADPYATDVLVTGVDIHIEEDTLGSQSEYIK